MQRSAVLYLSFVSLIFATAFAHEPVVKPLLQVNLGNLASQEGLMLEVNLRPVTRVCHTATTRTPSSMCCPGR